MSKQTKIAVIGPSIGYARWMPGKLVPFEEADIVVLTGGEDISPSIYGEEANRRTYCTPKRDSYEIFHYKKAVLAKKKIIGICRGHQLIVAMNGGKLIQHMDHPYSHIMDTFDGETVVVNSLHHQQVYPFNLPENKYTILGWSPMLSPIHLGGNNEEMAPPVEIEGIYFPETKALGWQFHPEMMDRDSKAVEYCTKIFKLFVSDQLDEYIQDVNQNKLKHAPA